MVKIPSRLEELLPSAALEKVMEALGQPDLSSTVRDALGRMGLKSESPLGQVQDAWRQARSWIDDLAAKAGFRFAEPTAINATGSLINEQFAEIPVASTVGVRFAKSATASQISDVLEQKAKKAGQQVFGASTCWLNGTLVSLQLLQRMAPDRGVLMTRTDAVRIPGVGDVQEMLQAFGKRITEVGAANGCSDEDWAAVELKNQDIVLLVSLNGQSAEARAAKRVAAVRAAKAAGAKVVEFLVDGVVNEKLASEINAPYAPSIHADADVDLVLLPLNTFLSGPPGMVAFGNEQLVQSLANSAKRINAALTGPLLASATTALQIASFADEIESGVSALLLTSAENLKNRARRLSVQLNDTQLVREAVELERTALLGPSPWDAYSRQTWGIRLKARESADQLLHRLASPAEGITPVVATKFDGDVFLDLRFVPPESDHEIVLNATHRAPLENKA